MKHVMIDIETMGTNSNSPIISLGATKFDPAGSREIEDSFYVSVSLESCLATSKLDASTVLWWMSKERTEAREAWLAEEKVSLVDALEGFAIWFGPQSLPTWGNGATFDNVIVRNAMAAIGVECPWSFRDDRCFRTLKAMYPLSWNIEPPDGVPHHALYDAIYQTYQLQVIYSLLAGSSIKQLEPGTYV